MPLSFFSQPRFSPLAFPGWPEPSALASSTPRIHSAISLHKTWHRWNSVLESRDDGAGGPKPPCQRNRHLPNCPIAPGSGNAGRAGDQGRGIAANAGLRTSRSSGRNSSPCAQRSGCSRWSWKALKGPAMHVRPRIHRLTLAVWRCLLISSVARKYPTGEMRALAEPPRRRQRPPPAADYLHLRRCLRQSRRHAASAAASASTGTAIRSPRAPPPLPPPRRCQSRRRRYSPPMWRAVTLRMPMAGNKQRRSRRPAPLARGCARRRKIPCQFCALGPQTFRCIRRKRTGADNLLGADRRLVPGAAAQRCNERQAATSLFDEKIEIQIATQPDDFWSREDPQEVMDDIAKMAGWDVGKQKKPLFTVTGNVFDDLKKGRGKTPEPEPEPEPASASAPEPDP
jgi:hypothetical protein